VVNEERGGYLEKAGLAPWVSGLIPFGCSLARFPWLYFFSIRPAFALWLRRAPHHEIVRRGLQPDLNPEEHASACFSKAKPPRTGNAPGAIHILSYKTLSGCAAALAVVTVAFFLLPTMARCVVTGAEGPQGRPDIWPSSPNRV